MFWLFIYCHFSEKKFIFKFLWLFRSFLELYVNCNGFMCTQELSVAIKCYIRICDPGLNYLIAAYDAVTF